MKRTWKNFKLDMNKVHKFIGQVTIVIGFHAMWAGMLFYGFMTATTLN